MNYNMNQQTAIIAFSVIFVFSVIFYANLDNQGEVAPSEPAMVVDLIEDGTVGDVSGDIPPATNEVINIEPEEPVVTEESTDTETPPILEAFDDNALEGEFDDIQTGIDLLNNPLQ